MTDFDDKYQTNECGCTFVRKCHHAKLEEDLRQSERSNALMRLQCDGYKAQIERTEGRGLTEKDEVILALRDMLKDAATRVWGFKGKVAKLESQLKEASRQAEHIAQRYQDLGQVSLDKITELERQLAEVAASKLTLLSEPYEDDDGVTHNRSDD